MSVDYLHIDIEKHFGDFDLVLKADVPLDGVTAVFGLSGSGKSSLLRLIAGLERPDMGIIQLGEEVWVDSMPSVFVPPHQRNMAYVFQGGQSLPHLSVQGNLRYADKRAKTDQHEYDMEAVLSAFDLSGLLERRPQTLSGGERQRVALAQALLTRPRLLLLDEPLSALDQQRKQEILPYLDRLQSQFSLPMLYVSHDINEVIRLADHTLVLHDGHMVGFGETVQTLNAHGFHTSEHGRSGTILTGEVSEIDERLQLMTVLIGGHILHLPYDQLSKPGRMVRVILRASEIALSTKAAHGLSIQNSLQGQITKIEAQDGHAVANVTVNIGDEREIPVQVTRSAIESLGLTAGSSVFALVKTASLIR